MRTPSFQKCRELHDLGIQFPNTDAAWLNDGKQFRLVARSNLGTENHEGAYYPAPTLAEMVESLPPSTMTKFYSATSEGIMSKKAYVQRGAKKVVKAAETYEEAMADAIVDFRLKHR